MDAQVPVDAGWALWGKQQGTRIDYSVLACSTEPLSETEFNHVLTHFVAGTPSAEPHRPDSLPWVIVSRVGVGEQVYVGISIQDLAGTRDAAGRPVISTSYFCIPYAAISGAPVTYSGLYQRLNQDVRLPYRDDSLIRLSVPRLDPAGAARDVERFGESVVAATAAMLLSGSVSVVGAEKVGLAERLAFIDAVAALLPYGYRGAYTAATWSDSGTRHPIRLAFAARPRQNAGVIRWGTGPATPVADDGEQYLALYQHIRDRLPQADQVARADQLTKLVGRLARDAASCGWDQPERALQALRDFDLPFLVLTAVRAGSVGSAAGSVTSSDVRRVFTEKRIEELAPDQRLEVLAELIVAAYREPANWPVADEWWEPVASHTSVPLLPRIVATAQELVLASAPEATITEYTTRASRHGILDPLLAGLVAGQGGGTGRMARARAVADQIADSGNRQAGPLSLPDTQRALARNPLVACLLICRLADTQPDLEPLRNWLEPVLGGTLTAFFTLLARPPGPVSASDMEILASPDAGCVVLLLRTAHGRERLDLVLPGFTSWLGRVRLQPGGGNPELVAYCRDRALALQPAEPEAQAWLDLMLLLTSDRPRYLLESRDKPSQQRYDNEVARGWAVLANNLGRAGDEALTRTLRDFLAQGSWAHDGAQAAAVVGLVTLLTRDGQRRALGAAVTEVLARTSSARRWSFARDWLPLSPQNKRPAPESKRPAPESKRPAPENRQPTPDNRQPGTYEGHHSAESRDWQVPDKHGYPAPKGYSPAPPGGEPARAATPRPDTTGAGPVATRSVLSPDATAAEVAEYCTAALKDQRRLGDVIKELTQAGAIRSAGQACDILRVLRYSLVSPSGNSSEVENWLKRLTEHFADDSSGPGAGSEFRLLAAQSMIEDISRLSEMLRIVVAWEEHGLLDPNDGHTEQLSRAIRSLDETRKDGKKRPSRTPRSILRGWQGGDGGE
jgi:hypothetical protein